MADYQRQMLMRILNILEEKIAMGQGMRHHRMHRHHRLMHHGGDEGGDDGGVMAGRRRRVHHKKVVHRKKKAGTYAGVSAGRRKVHKKVVHRRKRGGASDWIEYVKHYASKHGISYREALSEAGPSYHKHH